MSSPPRNIPTKTLIASTAMDSLVTSGLVGHVTFLSSSNASLKKVTGEYVINILNPLS